MAVSHYQTTLSLLRVSRNKVRAAKLIFATGAISKLLSCECLFASLAKFAGENTCSIPFEDALHSERVFVRHENVEKVS